MIDVEATEQQLVDGEIVPDDATSLLGAIRNMQAELWCGRCTRVRAGEDGSIKDAGDLCSTCLFEVSLELREASSITIFGDFRIIASPLVSDARIFLLEAADSGRQRILRSLSGIKARASLDEATDAATRHCWALHAGRVRRNRKGRVWAL